MSVPSSLPLDPAEDLVPHPLGVPGRLPALALTFDRSDVPRWPVDRLATPWLAAAVAARGVSAASSVRSLTLSAEAVLVALAAEADRWEAFRDGVAERLDALDVERRVGLRVAEARAFGSGGPDAMPAAREAAEALLVAEHDPALTYGRAWLAALDATVPPLRLRWALVATLEDLRRSPRSRSVLASALREALPTPPPERVARDAVAALDWLAAAYAPGSEIPAPDFRDAYVAAGSPGGLDRDGSGLGCLVPTLARLGRVAERKRHGGRRTVSVLGVEDVTP